MKRRQHLEYRYGTSWQKCIIRKLKKQEHQKSANSFIFTKRQLKIKTLSSRMLKKCWRYYRYVFFFLSCHLKDFVRLFLMQLAERLKSLCSLKKILLNYSLFWYYCMQYHDYSLDISRGLCSFFWNSIDWT